jgi:hypothetical protein
VETKCWLILEGLLCFVFCMDGDSEASGNWMAILAIMRNGKEWQE